MSDTVLNICGSWAVVSAEFCEVVKLQVDNGPYYACSFIKIIKSVLSLRRLNKLFIKGQMYFGHEDQSNASDTISLLLVLLVVCHE